MTSSSEIKYIGQKCASSPRQGMSLESATEKRAVHVRKAVRLLSQGFNKSHLLDSFKSMFTPMYELDVGGLKQISTVVDRAAWNLVSIWLLARNSGNAVDSSDFIDCEKWFFGNVSIKTPYLSSLVITKNCVEARNALLDASIDDDFSELLPYILQELGPGSRSSVLRDSTNITARTARKRQGIFYTPRDVTDYMARNVFSNYSGKIEHARCLDPACGTGVFLLALCRQVEQHLKSKELFNRFEYVTNNLFGCDVSVHAAEACTFVLLSHCLADIKKYALSPWLAWHIIRLNVANIDSLTLRSKGTYHHKNLSLRERQREKLLSGDISVIFAKQHLQELRASYPRNNELPRTGMIEISEIFAEAGDGFHILIGNPPYSQLGQRMDYEVLSREYSSYSDGAARAQDNLFLPFIEMMWRLTTPRQSSSTLITPLSIAYNSGSRFVNCRRAVSQNGGLLRFAFFDREPHALFGEEVKTRNAIMFRIEDRDSPQRGKPALIETGPINKWTSRTRGQLFNRIHFTSCDSLNIDNGIPKVNGQLQWSVLNRLQRTPTKFEHFCKKIGKCSLNLSLEQKRSGFVYVGGTAYNFLNVFRGLPTDLRCELPLSESSIHCLEFMTEKEASIAFAFLSSRLVFWLWHVQSDGFHVSGQFIKNLPFQAENLTTTQLSRLNELGERLWTKVQTYRFSNVNKGKLTYTFRPLACNEERNEIDSIFVEASGVPSGFVSDLQEFVRNIVVIDEFDTKRKYLNKYFIGGTEKCLEI